MTKTQNSSLITNRNHPLVKRIRALHRREERDQTKHYFVEGMRFVAQATQSSTRIQTLVYAPRLISHPFAKHLVKQQQKTGTTCLMVSPEVMHTLSLCDDSQGIGAVVSQRWHNLEDINPTRDLCWIVLETVQSPGNLGTILRTGEAVGAAGVILLGDSVDAYDPGTVRASMAALFRQKFVRTTLPQLLAWKEKWDCPLVGTSPAAPHDYRNIEYSRPTLLFMGGERKGLSKEHLAACDRLVKLPMVGRADSLNLAVATGVMLYEIFAQNGYSTGAPEKRARICGEMR